MKISTTQLVIAAVIALDAAGNPAQITDAPSWSISDSSVAKLTAAVDGLSATITAVAPGDVTVTVTDGTLTASATVTVASAVVPGVPASLVINFGEPTEQTA